MPKPERLSVVEYFERPETLNPTELVYGMVREPPAPKYGHQSLITHIGALLDRHVREHKLGQVCVSPVDVVLDEANALVVQPDIIFIADARLHIVQDRVWGPPDLVIEVLSRGTARRDRTTKVEWYRRYGVPECWLIDRWRGAVEVLALQSSPRQIAEFRGQMIIRSASLPQSDLMADEVFG